MTLQQVTAWHLLFLALVCSFFVIHSFSAYAGQPQQAQLITYCSNHLSATTSAMCCMSAVDLAHMWLYSLKSSAWPPCRVSRTIVVSSEVVTVTCHNIFRQLAWLTILFTPEDNSHSVASDSRWCVRTSNDATVHCSCNIACSGLLAYIVEKFRAWSDCNGSLETRFTKDQILTGVSIYWFNANITSSFRMYCESMGPYHQDRATVSAYVQMLSICLRLCWHLCTPCEADLHCLTLPYLRLLLEVANSMTKMWHSFSIFSAHEQVLFDCAMCRPLHTILSWSALSYTATSPSPPCAYMCKSQTAWQRCYTSSV